MAAAPQTTETGTRRLQRSDLPQAAALFATIFRAGRPIRMASLIAHMQDLYFDGPWVDPEIGALVHTAPDGSIDGFFGVLAIPMRWRGARVRAGVTGTLMVSSADPRATLQLCRTFMAGPQDVSLSDTANARSLGLHEALKFTTIGESSLEWYRVLSPGGLAGMLLRRRIGWAPSLGSRVLARRFAPKPVDTVRDAAVDRAAWMTAARALTADLALRPDWDDQGFAWQMDLAARKMAFGPMHLQQVHSRAGSLVGAYLWYGQAGGAATVLTVLLRPDWAIRVAATICATAAAHGCVAVRGRASHPLMGGLLRLPNTVLRSRGATVVHACDPQIVAAALRGDALLGGFVGDSFTPLASEAFED